MVRVSLFFVVVRAGDRGRNGRKAVGHRPRCVRCGEEENKVSDSGYFWGAQGGRARMVDSPPLSDDCVKRKKRR